MLKSFQIILLLCFFCSTLMAQNEVPNLDCIEIGKKKYYGTVDKKTKKKIVLKTIDGKYIELTVDDKLKHTTVLSSNVLFRIETIHGSKLNGYWLATDTEYLTIHDQNISLVKVLLKDINEISLSGGKEVTTKKVVQQAAFLTELMVPSATTLKKGELFYRNGLLVGNGFFYGITDGLTVGVGFELASIINAISWGENPIPAVLLHAEYGHDINEYFRIGAGINIFTQSQNVGNQTFAMPYGVATFHKNRLNLSVSGGYKTVNRQVAGGATFGANAAYVLTKRLIFHGEFYNMPVGRWEWQDGSFRTTNMTIPAIGIRFHHRKTAYGLGITTDSWGNALPILDFTYKIR